MFYWSKRHEKDFKTKSWFMSYLVLFDGFFQCYHFIQSHNVHSSSLLYPLGHHYSQSWRSIKKWVKSLVVFIDSWIFHIKRKQLCKLIVEGLVWYILHLSHGYVFPWGNEHVASPWPHPLLPPQWAIFSKLSNNYVPMMAVV